VGIIGTFFGIVANNHRDIHLEKANMQCWLLHALAYFTGIWHQLKAKSYRVYEPTTNEIISAIGIY
jgi:hypothetical protein